jgi:hypothetical protein
VLDVGNKSWNDDNIFPTLPESLVGDMYVAAFGVPNVRLHSRTPSSQFARRGKSLPKGKVVRHNKIGSPMTAVGHSRRR